MVSDVKKMQTTAGVFVEVDQQSAEALLKLFAANTDRELVSVPPSVLDAMALAIQQLTAKADLLGRENVDLHGQLEKAQAELALQNKKHSHVVNMDMSYSRGYTTLEKLVQKIEAACTKMGLEDRTVSWTSTDVTVKLSGPASDVAKIQEWISYWRDSGTSVP
jgi:hypothetical protein